MQVQLYRYGTRRTRIGVKLDISNFKRLIITTLARYGIILELLESNCNATSNRVRYNLYQVLYSITVGKNRREQKIFFNISIVLSIVFMQQIKPINIIGSLQQKYSTNKSHCLCITSLIDCD